MENEILKKWYSEKIEDKTINKNVTFLLDFMETVFGQTKN